MSINLNTYYRGAGAERVQELADNLGRLASEADQAGADDAAMHLADLATQLLDLGVDLAAHRGEYDHA
jgi:hypothetical protein